ncbi:MAG: hypothetical protein HQL42_15570 [Alphaproteobacteria bacterium]|nr:hypothetical protein [Alphaproteobacteria bacterium]
MIQIPFTTDTFAIETGQAAKLMGHDLGSMEFPEGTPEADTFMATARYMVEVGYPVVTIDSSSFDWQMPLDPQEAAWARRDAKAQGMVAFRFTETVVFGAMTVTGITVVNRMCAGTGGMGLLAHVAHVDGGLLIDVDSQDGGALAELIDHCCARVLPAAVWS